MLKDGRAYTAFPWLAFAALFLLAVAMRAVLPPLPFLVPDSVGYMMPGISWVTDGTFTSEQSRNFIYPLFIGSILKLGGSYATVASLQHGLFLLMTVLFFWVWLHVFQGSPTKRLGYALVALVALTAHLCAQHSLWYEHSIGPEAIFPALFLLLASLVLMRPREISTYSFLWLLCFILLNFLLLQVMSKWILALPLSILAVLLTTTIFRRQIVQHIIACLLGVALAWALFIFPNNQLQQKYDPEATSFLPEVLFFFHYDLIQPGLQDLRPDSITPDAYQELLADLNRGYEDECQRLAADEQTPFEKFKYNPDNLLFKETGVRFQSAFEGRLEDYNAFCKNAFIDAVKRNPLGYAGKVLGQLELVYRIPAMVFPRQLKARWFTQERYQQDANSVVNSLPQSFQEAPIVESLKQSISEEGYRTKGESIYGPFLWRNFNAVIYILNWIFLPTLLIFLGGVVNVFFRKRAMPFLEDPVAGVVILAYLAGFGINLSVALTHALEFDRYLYFQMIINTLATIGAWWLILSFRMLCRKIPQRMS